MSDKGEREDEKSPRSTPRPWTGITRAFGDIARLSHLIEIAKRGPGGLAIALAAGLIAVALWLGSDVLREQAISRLKGLVGTESPVPCIPPEASPKPGELVIGIAPFADDTSDGVRNQVIDLFRDVAEAGAFRAVPLGCPVTESVAALPSDLVLESQNERTAARRIAQDNGLALVLWGRVISAKGNPEVRLYVEKPVESTTPIPGQIAGRGAIYATSEQTSLGASLGRDLAPTLFFAVREIATEIASVDAPKVAIRRLDELQLSIRKVAESGGRLMASPVAQAWMEALRGAVLIAQLLAYEREVSGDIDRWHSAPFQAEHTQRYVLAHRTLSSAIQSAGFPVDESWLAVHQALLDLDARITLPRTRQESARHAMLVYRKLLSTDARASVRVNWLHKLQTSLIDMRTESPSYEPWTVIGGHVEREAGQAPPEDAVERFYWRAQLANIYQRQSEIDKDSQKRVRWTALCGSSDTGSPFRSNAADIAGLTETEVLALRTEEAQIWGWLRAFICYASEDPSKPLLDTFAGLDRSLLNLHGLLDQVEKRIQPRHLPAATRANLLALNQQIAMFKEVELRLLRYELECCTSEAGQLAAVKARAQHLARKIDEIRRLSYRLGASPRATVYCEIQLNWLRGELDMKERPTAAASAIGGIRQ